MSNAICEEKFRKLSCKKNYYNKKKFHQALTYNFLHTQFEAFKSNTLTTADLVVCF